MRIFTDTSGLFAALVRNDINHDPAKATFAALLEFGAELHTTSYVLLESVALLQGRVGLDAALQFENVLRPLLQVTWMTEQLHDRSVRRWELKHSRQQSLVDCASFVVMEELGLSAAFGYDGDFATEGFQLVGRPEQFLEP